MFQKRHKKIVKLSLDSDDSEASEGSEENSQIYEKQFTAEDQYLIEMNWSGILMGKFEE